MVITIGILAFLCGYAYRHFSNPPNFAFHKRRREALKRAKGYKTWALR